MKKLFKVVLIALAIVLAFGLGYCASRFLPLKEEETMAEEPLSAPELRIYDSSIQWSDGVRWHIFTEVEELAEQDPIAAARKQALADNGDTAADTDDEAETDDVLGENRGEGSVARTYTGGGGGYSGGGGGGSDGQDISWSSDYL